MNDISEKTGRIRVLSQVVADQIAAGEVVERPASVVKELVENSIDAGATTIQLDIDAGGVGRIRVLDNGYGLGADDLQTAFVRHATSKIVEIGDLDTVATFGFRGEALPSIASVSRIIVRSRTADVVAGTELRMEGGTAKTLREAGCPVGTDFEVKDLFFNTPARLKFLKTESTEASHCAEALIRLALCNPGVSFKMTSNGRKVRELPRVQFIEERVKSLFPDELLARSEGEENGVRVLAVLGPPEKARAGAGSLYTYVNGRFIRDKALLRAVTQSFAGTLEAGRYPAGCISITLPAGSFDVNVHPQKTEVRFADPQVVFRAVSHIVGAMAARSIWSMRQVDAGQLSEPSEAYNENTDDNVLPGVPHFIPGFPAPPPVQTRSAFRTSFPTGAQVAPGIPASAGKGGPIPLFQPTAKTAGSADPEAPFSSLTWIGQGKGTFLLFDDETDLVIVDQHAAHERVTYERLRKQLDKGTIASQRLLSPHLIDLGPAEVDRITGHAESLSRLGLSVEQAGADRIAIRGIPAELAHVSPDRLLADMIIALEQKREGSRGDLEDLVIATMACHSSIRAGRTVTQSEVSALLGEMDRIDFAGHCPHGRPVLTRIPWSEIRKRVERE